MATIRRFPVDPSFLFPQASWSYALSISQSINLSHSLNPVPSVGHGSARHPRDVCDRARRRFVSSRFIRFMYNLRFDMAPAAALSPQPLVVSINNTLASRAVELWHAADVGKVLRYMRRQGIAPMDVDIVDAFLTRAIFWQWVFFFKSMAQIDHAAIAR
eukprot:scaffold1354_cov111-Isochrysis_galbana.AAC.6